MNRQPDPAIVRAVLAKHHDGDQPTACETCVLADALTSEQHATHDYATETRRLRQRLTTWADNVTPELGYSGAHIQHMITSILEATQ